MGSSIENEIITIREVGTQTGPLEPVFESRNRILSPEQEKRYPTNSVFLSFALQCNSEYVEVNSEFRELLYGQGGVQNLYHSNQLSIHPKFIHSVCNKTKQCANQNEKKQSFQKLNQLKFDLLVSNDHICYKTKQDTPEQYIFSNIRQDSEGNEQNQSYDQFKSQFIMSNTKLNEEQVASNI